MQCGHCGTQINNGFTTCPACGAVYRKRPGMIAQVSRTTGVLFLVLGFTDPTLDRGRSFLITGAVLFAFGCFAVWRTPYLWWRREP